MSLLSITFYICFYLGNSDEVVTEYNSMFIGQESILLISSL